MENLEILVRELIKYSNELPWIEFKHNNYDPEMIGEDISALANGATLEERGSAYLLWGVDDSSRDIVGTNYDLQSLKKGGEELQNWLRRMLSENADFEYQLIAMDNIAGETVKVGVLVIRCATNYPVSFKKEEYIRVGSYTKKLREYPAFMSRLWVRLHNIKFEELYAKEDLQLTDALRSLEYTAYFDLSGTSQPTSPESIAHYLLEDGILAQEDNGLYAITNMGAILLAKKISEFPKLSRKAIRIVQYKDNNKLTMLREYVGEDGYIVSFESLMKYIDALLPAQEVISGAVRETKTAYPLLAIREAVANALIHQDFSVSGTGPTVEIFSNRIEIINSGTPLVSVERIIDNPPKSRNEKLAAMMRRLKMCEELGTGWDKIVWMCELWQLPAPKIEIVGESTKVTLFSEVPFNSISPDDKLRACYLHACIMHVQGNQLTNSSLRQRFGLKPTSSGSVSRLIKEAVESNYIKPLDPTTSNKYMRYVPYWA